MHILYLYQYFTTRSRSRGMRAYEFARYLQGRGHQVTIVTAASTVSGIRGRSSWREVDGIKVAEANAGFADYLKGNQMGYSRRMLGFFSFALASARLGLSVPKPDVVFASSTPLTIGIPGLAVSTIRRVPLVFEVRDLWPEAPIQIGALKSPLLIHAARWLEKAIYRRSAHIVALSPGMRDGILSSGVPAAMITVIPNASDLDLFSPEVDGSAFRRKLGLDGKFACVYFGAMGVANGLQFVLDAASELQQRGENNIVFVLHGQGKERALLENRCKSEKLNNVVFSEPVPGKEEVALLAAAADVCMTIYRNLPVLYTCSPNKLFDSLAAGRPVLVNMPGWLQETVEQNRAGVFVEPDNPIDFADKVIHLKDHPELCAEYGKNARLLAEERFARSKLAAQLEQVLLEAARS